MGGGCCAMVKKINQESQNNKSTIQFNNIPFNIEQTQT
jgi:hypothetical protein